MNTTLGQFTQVYFNVLNIFLLLFTLTFASNQTTNNKPANGSKEEKKNYQKQQQQNGGKTRILLDAG